jgi:hypothetical protein
MGTRRIAISSAKSPRLSLSPRCDLLCSFRQRRTQRCLMPKDLSQQTASRAKRVSASGLEKAEHRSNRRYSSLAAVEITELSSGARRSARTSNLSLDGCYIDILNPFPRGTLVHLRISCNKGIFETQGSVVSSHAGFWMGVGFSEMTPDQRSVLEALLAELDIQCEPS